MEKSASKVVFGGETVVDLTQDTVTPETLAEGITAHNAAGEAIVGEMVVDSGSDDESSSISFFPISISMTLTRIGTNASATGSLTGSFRLKCPDALNHQSFNLSTTYENGLSSGTAFSGILFGNDLSSGFPTSSRDYYVNNDELEISCPLNMKSTVSTVTSRQATIKLL